ncbi:MAG: DUF1549 domain-containing protein [Planctomycetaceae bacterium]
MSKAGELKIAGLLLLALAASECNAEPPAKIASSHAKEMQRGLALFRKQVRPVLIEQCLKCHGGNATRGKLDLSTRRSLMKRNVIGKTAQSSRLMSALRHTVKPFMPKDAAKLPAATLKHFADWINLGAPYDKPLIPGVGGTTATESISESDRRFWSFRPLQIVPPPTVNSRWVRTPVDRFVLAAMQRRGLSPNPLADRRVLIRRAYFDLIGLPPTPVEIEAFVKNPDSHAYEKLIDGLLKSPHYGERWARHWMDVARFAESYGYEQDYDRKHAWPYRDFLIRALNADMPYDRFVRWQIAGDELAPNDPLALTATGFLGAGAFPTQLTETEFERSRYDELDDMVSTTGVAFLGLSIGCARCHDHKYDPIPTADYYRLAAVFTTTIRAEIDLKLPGANKKTKVQVTSEGFKPMKHNADGRGFPHFYPATYRLERGDVKQKQRVAKPGYLQVLMRDGRREMQWRKTPPANWKRTSFRRAGLANWLTDAKHGAGHLAARVIVNRLWQYHFGRGIVATPNDFGAQGKRPSHPELLDWLAADLIRHGWKLKRLHKLIVTSAVYMQSSQSDKSRMRVDPKNVWLWRRVPRRLEAEAIRDAMLAVSGRLDKTMYGPGTLDPRMKRRSVYFFIKRSKLIPMMVLFDWPEHLVSIGRRSETTIAPQSLMFLNSPLVRDYAKGFARRIKAVSLEDFVRNAFRRALGRSPTAREQTRSTAFLQRQSQRYRNAGKKNGPELAKVDLCQTLFSMNEFLFVD